MTTETNAFQAGADFISFDASPPSPPHLNGHSNATAGPSRISQNGISNPKRKYKPDDSRDEEEVNEVLRSAGKQVNGNGDRKGKGKGKGKGKKQSRRDEDCDTGPRNLKEERKAAERHVPWADMVQWDRCQDPAEMYAIPTRQLF